MAELNQETWRHVDDIEAALTALRARYTDDNLDAQFITAMAVG
jgi:hypothetical protein